MVGSNVCAAGWAFATATTFSLIYTKHLRLTKANSTFVFSPQQLIDCSANANYNNFGCYAGGSIYTSWKYY